MTATLVLNVDMGSYSPMFGSAQRLANGDYSFLSGGQGTGAVHLAQTIEVRPDGSRAYVLAENKWVYRSFRIQTLYEGVSDQLAGDGGGVEFRDRGDFRDTSRGDLPRRDGPAGASFAATTGFPDDFGLGVTAALNGPADQPAVPVPFAVASSFVAIAAPPVPVGDPNADPAFSDLSHDVTGAASDALRRWW